MPAGQPIAWQSIACRRASGTSPLSPFAAPFHRPVIPARFGREHAVSRRQCEEGGEDDPGSEGPAGRADGMCCPATERR